MDQQNQFNQSINSSEQQPSSQPEVPQKAGLPTWAIVSIVVLSVIVVGLAGYGVYRYFTSKPERAELLMVTEEELTETPAKTATIDYPDSPIFYEYDDQVWQFNLKSEVKKKIANGIRPVISPDKTKIAYTYQGSNKYFKPSEVNLTGIHLFDIATGKDKLLKHYDKDYPVWQTSWSPDGKYLVIDTGTSPVRDKTVIDSNNGKEILSFTTYSNSYAWINDNEIVFSDLQDITEPRPYGGGGEGTGIAIINLNGQKRVLKTATDKKDYSFIQLVDDKIYFSLTTVESSEGWIDESKQTISYWTMDKFGNNLIQVEKIEGLGEKIKKLLPSPYNEYKSLWYATSLTNNKDWTVFILNKESKTTLEDEIFIMDINNPESIKKIGNGTWPTW